MSFIPKSDRQHLIDHYSLLLYLGDKLDLTTTEYEKYREEATKMVDERIRMKEQEKKNDFSRDP